MTDKRSDVLGPLRQDLSYAVRTLIRAPGFVLVTVLTLAIGILGNTTVVSGVNAVLFTPLPTERPEQIAQILTAGRDVQRFAKHTYALYTTLRDNNATFAELAAILDATVPISDRPDGERAGQNVSVVRGEVVSGNYFRMLGVKTAQGRGIAPEDDRTPNAHPVAVISERLWKTRFNADPNILGRTTYLKGHPFTIIGVTPASFSGTVFANQTDFWAPLMMQEQLGGRPNWWRPGGGGPAEISVSCHVDDAGKEHCGSGQQVGDLRVLGRLKPDVSADAASAQLTALAATVPAADKTVKPPVLEVVQEVQARHRSVLTQVRGISALALGASALVWLIACANVANLGLARAGARRREIAIRLSLGAARARVARQVLTESLLLALVAGIVAVLLTYWTAGLLGAAIPANVPLPITLDFTPDLRVLGWALGLSVATGLVFGCAPAWQAVRTNLVPSLKPGESGSSQGSRRLTLRNALVVAQLSISVVVLIAGGLFVRSLNNAREAFSPGFDADRLLSMRLDPGVLGYSGPRVETFYLSLLRELKEVRQIESVSLAASPPFGSYGSESGIVQAAGSGSSGVSAGDEIGFNTVGPRYFSTMGVPLAAGRDFEERDLAGTTPVGILSEPTAKRLFGSVQAALGKRVNTTREGHSARLEIIGVTEEGPRVDPGFENRSLYLPFTLRSAPPAFTLIVRASSSGALSSLAEAVRGVVRHLDPAMPVSEVRKGEGHAAAELGAVRLTTEIAMLLGLVALTLASLGLYGVVSYSVSMRAREIGIRVALGAPSATVRALILGHGMVLTAIGLAVGLCGSLLVTPVLQSRLIDLPANDPATFAGISILLVAIAVAACYLPARRATRIDPIVALKCE
jgi:predicted permease